MPRKITEKDVEFIKENKGILKAKDIAEKLGLTIKWDLDVVIKKFLK